MRKDHSGKAYSKVQHCVASDCIKDVTIWAQGHFINPLSSILSLSSQEIFKAVIQQIWVILLKAKVRDPLISYNNGPLSVRLDFPHFFPRIDEGNQFKVSS